MNTDMPDDSYQELSGIFVDNINNNRDSNYESLLILRINIKRRYRIWHLRK